MILQMICFYLVLKPTGIHSHQKHTREESTGIYQQVPEDQRQSLRQAVDKLLEAEQRADWKAVYQLLDTKPGQTEESFLRETKHRPPLREFRPYGVTFIPPDSSWVIQGCASFADDLTAHGHLADITANWRESRWHVSPVAFELVGNEKGGKLQDCPLPE